MLTFLSNKISVKTFHDIIHLTPEGNQLVARKVVPYIEQEFRQAIHENE